MMDHVKVPAMGEGVHEATLVKWLRQVGDAIKANDPLLEISTDKVDTEIVAPRDGFLVATFVAPGAVVAVDQVVAQVSAQANATVQQPGAVAARGSSPHRPSTNSRENAPRRNTAARLIPTGELGHSGQAADIHLRVGTFAGIVRASPLVKKIAHDQGIDLHQVKGTGQGGRVTKDDVLDFLDSHRVGASAQGAVPESALYKTELVEGRETLDGVVVRREPMSQIRRLTAQHMAYSVRTSPHVTTTFEVDLHNIVAVKKRADEQVTDKQQRLTFTAFFIFAAVQALKEFPQVNASVDGDDILYKDTINIGCAVAIPSGLIVPVLKDAGRLSLRAVSQRLNDLVTRAHKKQLLPPDVQGGTFSVTNPGTFGSLHSQPIINQPQGAIMSVGAIVERPMFVGTQVLPRPLCQIGITFDHRLIDGKEGALFLKAVKDHLIQIRDFT